MRTRLNGHAMTLADAVLVTATLLGVGLVAAAGPMFTSTWTAPEAKGVSFAGRKVAALVISSDESLRMSGEEQLARELTALGMQGVATYRIIPREELMSSERAKPWFERAGVEGVVSLRPVSVDTRRTYAPAVWVTSSYSTLWGYYGYGWTSVTGLGGSVREDRDLVVETLVHSVTDDALLWAGVSTTTNPKNAQAFVSDLVSATVKEMQTERLAK